MTKLVDLRRSEAERHGALDSIAQPSMPEVHFGLRGMFDQKDLERLGVDDGEEIEPGDTFEGHVKFHVLSAHTDKTEQGTETRVHWGITHAQLDDADKD